MGKHAKILIALVLILAVALTGLGSAYYLYRMSHIKVDGVCYS